MIVRFSELHFPQDPATLYPHNPAGEWHLEIGFGDGRFWAAHHTLEPQANYLGVEISGVSLLKAERRARTSAPQAVLTKADALSLLRAVPPEGSLSRIYINFPDPWPKAGHLEHRLMRRVFFETAAGRLRAGGEIWITTDHEEYFEFALEEARATGRYAITETEPPQAALQTKYALKWRDLGLGARHARLRLELPGTVLHPDFRSLSQIPEDHMPHSVVQLPPAFEISSFEKRVARSASATVVLLEAFRSASRPAWTFLAHVEEEGLTQEVLINATEREQDVLVRLDRFGGPIVTPGVKRAVAAVTDYLEERGSRVLMRAY
ncbi:tRNA (guanine-N7-)-methyltransferase [Deinobacterium chartae]|uniref:tRNA (guanine-N(7)-)-methyltransferase n=1 Tax=Deinobacterium chartae TaxID=521158 RepID=A0A841HY64_9DEIO|nr:tRNA (guanine-N7)-methyltransferase [Deinobacterium chartae]MBB6098337.1 tRNA (guanine-N7-)-methyltransferase [Deinobacterium chartae]